MKTEKLFSLKKTIAQALLEKYEYPWNALADIKSFTVWLGKRLSVDIFIEISENVWVG